MITEIESSVMPVSKDKKLCYPIVFEESFDRLAEVWKEYELSAEKICIVTDSNVEPLYAQSVKDELQKVWTNKTHRCYQADVLL